MDAHVDEQPRNEIPSAANLQRKQKMKRGAFSRTGTQIHRYCLKVYPRICHKIILRQKLLCRMTCLRINLKTIAIRESKLGQLS